MANLVVTTKPRSGGERSGSSKGGRSARRPGTPRGTRQNRDPRPGLICDGESGCASGVSCCRSCGGLCHVVGPWTLSLSEYAGNHFLTNSGKSSRQSIRLGPIRQERSGRSAAAYGTPFSPSSGTSSARRLAQLARSACAVKSGRNRRQRSVSSCRKPRSVSHRNRSCARAVLSPTGK